MRATNCYYGCGLVVPQAIEGATILDLGSGSGQDAYLLAQLVGEHGRVTGVDATQAQLAIANRHLDWHRDRFGYAQSNVRFVEGDIERLDALDLPDDGYDAIVSNCVINLVGDKAQVRRKRECAAVWMLLNISFYFARSSTAVMGG